MINLFLHFHIIITIFVIKTKLKREFIKSIQQNATSRLKKRRRLRLEIK
jgi:hypothetical protein